MFRPVTVLLATMSLVATVLAHEPRPAGDERALVQVAILLDTSNSMDGLIDQARTQLWKIVNEIGKCRRDGLAPRVQVALFEYGNSSISAGESYVRMVLPLSDNLDDVSEKLFALRTNGGEEYCGAVIQSAVNGLQWSSDARVYKSIFICGNEPFTQGPVDFRTTVPGALARGIVVNTIHCGTREEGMAGQWSAGAEAGRGSFMNINQDQKIVTRVTPFDPEIEKLSRDLNETYIPFGARGEASKMRQSEQDENASANAPSGAPVERAITKSSSAYDNSGWDLVDALKEKKVALDSVPEEALPETLRGKTLAEKQAQIDAQATRRGDVQKQISELNDKRQQFLTEHAEESEKDTFDAAMLEALQSQLKEQAFEVGGNK